MEFALAITLPANNPSFDFTLLNLQHKSIFSILYYYFRIEYGFYFLTNSKMKVIYL